MNDYQQTIKYLFDLQYSGIKLGLDNAARLLTFLGNPQKKWPAVHIAGTNGKGSSAAYIYTILKLAGYKVGLYTSPHLIDFSERIRINDIPIPWETIVDYTRLLRPEIDRVNATFFEATSAIAFHYFAENQVDIAVIETGLGGRLDATNLVEPLVTVITPISEDHQQYLGESILQIAREKAGIIKPGIPCITNNRDQAIVRIFRETCAAVNAPFISINPERGIKINRSTIRGNMFDLTLDNQHYHGLETSMAGKHQTDNAVLALAAVKNIKNFNITEQNIRDGLKQAKWPGRMQIIREKPLVILDAAHNPDGFRNILGFLRSLFPQKKIWSLIGLAKDKDFKTIADILWKHIDKIGVISKFSDRGLPADKLIGQFKEISGYALQFETIEEGYLTTLKKMSEDDILIIIGSHYLAGEFLQKIQFS
jgi:dihydrofolate synthase/folylpolyglutamate synthase